MKGFHEEGDCKEGTKISEQGQKKQKSWVKYGTKEKTKGISERQKRYLIGRDRDDIMWAVLNK